MSYAAKLPVQLGTVQKTLLVPLWARAMEAAEEQPVLRDPVAQSIMSRLDFDFSPLSSARPSQLGCCVRAALIDRWVDEFLTRHEDGSVVELGVGLGSRFERISRSRGHFFELDLPDVIALRQSLFPPHARRTVLPGDARGRDWLSVVKARRRPTLILAEGVLVYFAEADVRALFSTLAAELPGALCVFDSMTVAVVRLQRFHDAMRHFEARFTWALPEAQRLADWNPRYRLLRSERLFDLLYAHPARLPAWMRIAGPLVCRVWPGVKDSYCINLVQLGEPPAG
jgi:O-methyltransferase involved in polyketide biosynthesis